MGYNISLAMSVNKLTRERIQMVRVMYFNLRWLMSCCKNVELKYVELLDLRFEIRDMKFETWDMRLSPLKWTLIIIHLLLTNSKGIP